MENSLWVFWFCGWLLLCFWREWSPTSSADSGLPDKSDLRCRLSVVHILYMFQFCRDVAQIFLHVWPCSTFSSLQVASRSWTRTPAVCTFFNVFGLRSLNRLKSFVLFTCRRSFVEILPREATAPRRKCKVRFVRTFGANNFLEQRGFWRQGTQRMPLSWTTWAVRSGRADRPTCRIPVQPELPGEKKGDVFKFGLTRWLSGWIDGYR